jgi:hypothetical protein
MLTRKPQRDHQSPDRRVDDVRGECSLIRRLHAPQSGERDLPNHVSVILSVAFLYYWPTLLTLVSRAAPPGLKATVMGVVFSRSSSRTFCSVGRGGLLGRLRVPRYAPQQPAHPPARAFTRRLTMRRQARFLTPRPSSPSAATHHSASNTQPAGCNDPTNPPPARAAVTRASRAHHSTSRNRPAFRH